MKISMLSILAMFSFGLIRANETYHAAVAASESDLEKRLSGP